MVIFITGMVRSGTTFATDFVAQASGQRLAAQPLPLLFVHAMQRFKQSLGIKSDGYPLSDCVFKNAYRLDDLPAFLSEFSMTRDELARILELNSDYSGQQTKMSLNPENLPEGGLVGFESIVSQVLSNAEFQGVCGFGGSKETTCEEFIPYFAVRGWLIVLVIRDIRDVLCSLNYGKGKEFTGLPKPTLFNIRQWRKSVAFALNEGHRLNVVVVRFEDLLARPEWVREELAENIQRWTDVRGWTKEPTLAHIEPLGIENSSFTTESAIESRYESYLEPEVLEFVESLCWHELLAMGYEPNSPNAPRIPKPGKFEDPFADFRPELGAYLWNEQTYRQELQREEQLACAEFIPGNEELLISDLVREKLALTSRETVEK